MLMHIPIFTSIPMLISVPIFIFILIFVSFTMLICIPMIASSTMQKPVHIRLFTCLYLFL